MGRIFALTPACNTMDLLNSIANLTSPEMLHAIALRAGGFWLAQVISTAIVVLAMTAEHRPPRIWR